MKGDARTVVATRVEVARSLGARLKGLLGRDGWAETDGLLIDPCNSVHTVLLRFAIDVAFLDGDGRIVAVERLAKNRLGRIHPRARRALELPEGTADRCGLAPGVLVEFSATSSTTYGD